MTEQPIGQSSCNKLKEMEAKSFDMDMDQMEGIVGGAYLEK